MYLDESELLVNVSLLLLSSPSLLFLFGTNLSLAFPFLNPPWNAALAYIDMSIKEASQHKQTQIPDQNLHMNMILVKSFFFSDSWPLLLTVIFFFRFLTSPSFDSFMFMWRFWRSKIGKVKNLSKMKSKNMIWAKAWGKIQRQNLQDRLGQTIQFIWENKTKQKQATWEVLRLIQAWQWVH